MPRDSQSLRRTRSFRPQSQATPAAAVHIRHKAGNGIAGFMRHVEQI
jgi:hypothetical protein